MVGGVLSSMGTVSWQLCGLLTVTLMVLLTQWEPRIWVRWLARGSPGRVAPGGTRGMTVLLRLPLAVSVTHAAWRRHFCVVVTLAVCTAPAGRRDRLAGSSRHSQPWVLATNRRDGLPAAHPGSAHAAHGSRVGDSRLSPGVWASGATTGSSAVVVHFVHRLGALVVTLCVVDYGPHSQQYRAERRLLRPALLLGGLVLLQLTLGALTIWTRRMVLPMTAHVAVGAAVLATSVVIALRAARCTAAPAAVPGQGWRDGVGAGPSGPFLSVQVTTHNGTTDLQRVARRMCQRIIMDYLELAKARLVLMILVVTMVGFYMGAVPDWGAVASLLGVAFAAGGSLALNAYIEREVDALMPRTRRVLCRMDVYSRLLPCALGLSPQSVGCSIWRWSCTPGALS